jgi:hypothetical protein
MTTTQLDASLQSLNQAVTNRLADENRFKREVYDKINQIISQLNVCAEAVASASSSPARAAAVEDLSTQLRALNAEVSRLQVNRLTGADSDYVTQPLRAEANNNTLKWGTNANKVAFSPPDYNSGPAVGPPPPYRGPGGLGSWPSGRPVPSAMSSSGPSSSASSPSSFSFPSFPSLPSFPSTSAKAQGVTPIVPTRGTNDPRYRAGWSPKRKTPKRSPKKKTYRR